MRTLLVVVFVLVSLTLLAQPGPPPPDPGDPVPITGIEVLLVAGGALGLRKYYRRAHKK